MFSIIQQIIMVDVHIKFGQTTSQSEGSSHKGRGTLKGGVC